MENPVLQLLKARRATRAISHETLSEETIAELSEAVRLPPSCSNTQPWRFLFLESAAARDKVSQALTGANPAWAARAPLLVVGYTRRDYGCLTKDGRGYAEFDLGAAVMCLMLAATHLGLVARPMAGFAPDKIREAFKLEAADQPLVVVAVGQPSADEAHVPEKFRGIGRKPRERKNAKEIISRM